jgi:FkbH-like protein
MQTMHPHNTAGHPDMPLDQILANPQRQAEARSRLAAELARAPSTLTYLKWSKALPAAGTSRHIALLSSFTIETIAPFLCVEGYLSGWQPDARYLQYSQWQPALLNPADALAGVDLAILLIDDKAIEEQLGSTPAEAADAMRAVLVGFRSRSSLPLLVGLVPVRPAPVPYGLGLDRHQAALARIQAVNAIIADFCAGDPASSLIDLPGILTAAGAWHDEVAFAAKMSYVSHKAMPALAQALARNIGALLVPRRKVLVTDLDNTLWGGIVGEDGVEGIVAGGKNGRPYTAYQTFLGQLRASGVLLAVASKNNEADVEEAFSKRASDLAIAWDDFTATRVSWADKSESLKQIADELGLGLDSFVFVDDSAVECERIRQALPMVTIVQAPPGCVNLPELVLATRAFDTAHVSKEDLARAEQYRIERERRSVAASSTDLSDFLASLQLSIAIRPLSAENLDRTTQLLMKTNQFHLSLERPSASALLARQQNGNTIYALSLTDKFGDYGIIAVTEFERTGISMRIRNMAISCRALGRAVEETIIASAADHARQAGLEHIDAEFVRGPRNQLVPEAFAKLGFSSTDAGESKTHFRLTITAETPAWSPVVHLIPAHEGTHDSQ